MVNEFPDDDELLRLREKRLKEMEADLVGSVSSPSSPRALVEEVTDMNFADIVRTNRYLVVDCWAEWCGPCMTIGPVIEELATEFAGSVTFGKCDADMNAGVMQNFRITAIPTLLFFSGGALAGRLTGAYPKESIHATLLRTFGL